MTRIISPINSRIDHNLDFRVYQTKKKRKYEFGIFVEELKVEGVLRKELQETTLIRKFKKDRDGRDNIVTDIRRT